MGALLSRAAIGIGARRACVNDGGDVSLEIDHLFCMVEPGGGWDGRARAAGLVLDDGIEHPGQGTRNRRLFFADRYVEFLWVEGRVEAEGNPLRLDRRADWRATGGSPFGLGLRGTLTDAERAEFWPYRPPYAPGACILIHRANEEDPAQPLVFVFEAEPAAIERHLPRNRLAQTPHLINAGGIRALRLASPASSGPPPLLARVTPPIEWRRTSGGAPHLEVVLSDGPGLALTELLSFEADGRR
jgi:hypothetical protein